MRSCIGRYSRGSCNRTQCLNVCLVVFSKDFGGLLHVYVGSLIAFLGKLFFSIPMINLETAVLPGSTVCKVLSVLHSDLDFCIILHKSLCLLFLEGDLRFTSP